MVTRERIKKEIDKVRKEYLEALYKIVQAFGTEPNEKATSYNKTTRWHNFVRETYGCLADDPIERGAQGQYEIRDDIERPTSSTQMYASGI